MRRTRTCLESAPVTDLMTGWMMPWFVATNHPVAIASVAVGIALCREALGLDAVSVKPDNGA